MLSLEMSSNSDAELQKGDQDQAVSSIVKAFNVNCAGLLTN